MRDYSNQVNQPVETSIAYGQTKEQANEQVQEQRREEAGKVMFNWDIARNVLEEMEDMAKHPYRFKVRHPFIK